MKQNRPWSRQEEEKLLSLRKGGMTQAQCGAKLGRGPSSIKHKLTELASHQFIPLEGLDPEALRAFPEAASFSPERNPKMISLSDLAAPEPSVEQEWAEAEARSNIKLSRAKFEGSYSANMGALPVAVSFISDHHIDPGGAVAFQRMREDAELINSTEGCYAVVGGDGIENHIKHRGAIHNTHSTVSEQYRLYDFYLRMLNPLLTITGNHDAWSKDFAGIDMVGYLCKNNRLVCEPSDARLYMKVGNINYRVAVAHQRRFNSSFNLTHTVKRWLESGIEEFDVGVVCHHHSTSLEMFDYRRTSRVAIRPGSYKLTDSHSRQYGYDSSMQTCPTVVFRPDRKDPIAFKDVRTACEFLTFLRAKYQENLSDARPDKKIRRKVTNRARGGSTRVASRKGRGTRK